MIVHILLFPFILAICYLVPLVSTSFSKNNNLKWLSFWLITLASSYTIIPFLVWIAGQQISLLVLIMLAVIMMALLTNEKCQQIFGITSGAVQMISGQVNMVKQNVVRTMKQYGLIE